jgi:NAD(P)-dependent dehydrogenase (short-subunit alcohol dehydrogenase family)
VSGRLAGKVCVITGTGGSMGRASALAFASGWRGSPEEVATVALFLASEDCSEATVAKSWSTAE